MKHKTMPPKYVIAFNILKLNSAATTRKNTKRVYSSALKGNKL